jgi:hypothetical protein
MIRQLLRWVVLAPVFTVNHEEKRREERGGENRREYSSLSDTVGSHLY